MAGTIPGPSLGPGQEKPDAENQAQAQPSQIPTKLVGRGPGRSVKRSFQATQA